MVCWAPNDADKVVNVTSEEIRCETLTIQQGGYGWTYKIGGFRTIFFPNRRRLGPDWSPDKQEQDLTGGGCVQRCLFVKPPRRTQPWPGNFTTEKSTVAGVSLQVIYCTKLRTGWAIGNGSRPARVTVQKID
ncbi:hypothetical protein VFPPC_17801 [Pochonia chlamydosporia 170]|uniref:Uncharacterized protein n=1 Tax=Pochonia chlamydosporia 170 TaxID=1380566 RepID=A0A219AQE0_METCM|nr:hypothetical protein VFPPC_17801 [Pochonia chlamydosporia 170]OWT43006.1 hypothetical protein VFPPC_17801 [Pochonia chlamydosporia 170]